MSKKNSHAKEVFLKTLLVLCVMGFVFGAYKFYAYYRDQENAKKEYKQLAEEVTVKVEPTEAEPDKEEWVIDLDSVRALNEDAIGWITIPDTSINYPILRSKASEETYLRRNFHKNYDVWGSIFVYDYVDLAKPSQNIPIYGHGTYVRSDVMFCSLLRYKDYNYFKKNPIIEVETIYRGKKEYEIFAVSNIDYAETDFYFDQYDFSSDEEYQEFLNQAKSTSLYDTGVPVSIDDNIITLITCDSAEKEETVRVIVFAKEIK